MQCCGQSEKSNSDFIWENIKYSMKQTAVQLELTWKQFTAGTLIFKHPQNVNITKQHIIILYREKEHCHTSTHKSHTYTMSPVSSNLTFVPPYSGTNTFSPTLTVMGRSPPSYTGSWTKTVSHKSLTHLCHSSWANSHHLSNVDFVLSFFRNIESTLGFLYVHVNHINTCTTHTHTNQVKLAR